MRYALVAVALAAVSLSACATITRGKETVLQIETTPNGAQVKTSNNMSCASTPCGLKMARKSDNVVVTISKDGYKTSTVTMHTTVANGGGVAMAGNAVFGGIVGAVVDVNTGAMLDLTPNPLQVTLEKADAKTADAR